jgi:hypothetical protein
MTRAKYTPLHDTSRFDFMDQVEAPREISLEEMDAVAGGNDIKARLARMSAQMKSASKSQSECEMVVLLTCINIM